MALLSCPPLATSGDYQQSYQVDVHLCEPLRGRAQTTGVLMADILSRLTYLEVVLRKDAKMPSKHGRKLSFGTQQGKAEVLAQEIKGLARKLKVDDDPIKFLVQSFADDMMPHSSYYLQTGKKRRELGGADVDRYFAEIGYLHQVASLCDLLKTDANFSSNHKYIAHQTVLLYQSLKLAGTEMASHRKPIEQQFDNLKSACSHSIGTGPPQLNEPLRQWLTSETSTIFNEAHDLAQQSTVYPYMGKMVQALGELPENYYVS